MQIHLSDDKVPVITNDHGVDFSFADPEFWMYFSVPERPAFLIAKGFADYWHSTMGGSDERLPRSFAHAIASVHRAENLLELAQVSMPVPLFLHLPEYISEEKALLAAPSHRRAVEEATKRGTVVTAAELFRTSNPFEIPLLYILLPVEKRPSEPSHWSVWKAAASELFDQLRRLDLPSSYDTIIQQRFRLRDCLQDGAIYIRGRRLTSQEPLENVFPPLKKHRPVQWGPLGYDANTALNSHFCVSGMARSGKTTLLRILFQSLHAAQDLNVRFVLYDAKPEILPYLFSPQYLQQHTTKEELESSFYLLNPFDRRTTAWHIAADADSPENARHIAQVLFPDAPPNATTDYFPKAARNVAVAIMRSLRRKAGDKWSFYDLLAALQPENTMAVLAEYPDAQQVYQTYLAGTGSSSGDLAKTLSALTGLTMPAAWSWHNSTGPRLSLREWVKSQTKSIVLADNHAYPESSREINRILLDLLARYLLAIGKDSPCHTFLYLDEFEHLGHIPVLPILVKQGASLNVNLAMCFHDLGLLKNVYGAATEGIVGQCQFFAFLAVNDRSTAKWASDIIGEQEVEIPQHSSRRGTSPQHSSTDEMITFQRVSRSVVLPEEIRSLPLTDSANGLNGYFFAPQHHPYKGNIPATKLFPPRATPATDGKETYSLWPATPRIKEYESQLPNFLEPPEDTFSTLYELGFRKSGQFIPPAYDRQSEPESSDRLSDPERPTSGLLDNPFGLDFGNE